VKDSVKNILHKVYYSVSANFLTLAISLIVSFIVPKFLGVEQYGYWQLYAFYVSYVGFFHFGLVDGIYLRYGGKYYDKLDKSLMHSQYWLLFILEIFIFFFFIIGTFTIIDDSSKKFILLATGLNCFLILPRTLLQFILQGTGRIKEYAKNQIAERIIFTILVLGFLCLNYRSFVYMLIADIVAKSFGMLAIGWICRDIITAKGIRLSQAFHEFSDNISTGIKLLFANITGMLIIGIVRFGIERSWDVATFGKVSFSMNISTLVLTFISAVGVVIFPIIKRSAQERLPVIYNTLGFLLSVVMLFFLITYYPLQKIILLWLPHYSEAIKYFSILFPISMFEARSSLLINTYLKALREENAMLFINGFSVLLSLATTIVATVLLKDLTLTVMSIVVLHIVKCLIPDLYLQKKMKMKFSFEVLWDAFGAIIFVLGNWFVGGLQGWVVYIGFIIFVVIIRRNEFYQHLISVKEIIA